MIIVVVQAQDQDWYVPKVLISNTLKTRTRTGIKAATNQILGVRISIVTHFTHGLHRTAACDISPIIIVQQFDIHPLVNTRHQMNLDINGKGKDL